MTYEFITEQSRINTLLPELMAKPAWGFDTETNGLNPHVNKAILMQFGRPEGGYVIDVRGKSLEPLRPVLESSEILKIAHHAKFDYKMTKGTFGIDIEGLRCTFTTDKILFNGKRPYFYKARLDEILLDWLGVIIHNKKEMQLSFVDHVGPFSIEQLDYAYGDTAYMVPCLKKQSDRIKKEGLVYTYLLENNCISAFGDMEFAGILLDPDKWLGVMNENIGMLQQLVKDMDDYADPYVGADLFGKTNINYGSPKQILEIMQKMRMKVPVWDKESRSEKMVPIKKTNDKVLQTICHYPFVKMIQQWRSLNVRINTFGESYVNAIDPHTGKIHPDFYQMGAENGRPSAGKSAVNPLNIPRDNRYRNCIVAGPDEVIETDDYSGCESRIQAGLSGDPRLMQIFREGKDIHCEVASDLFDKVIQKGDKLRDPAKELNFGTSYGQGPGALYEKLISLGFNYTRDDVKNLYYKYCSKYKKAVNFIRENGGIAAKDGKIVNITGRRRYFNFKKDLTEDQRRARKAAIEREGGNYVISSVNSDITKKAMIGIRKYIKQNNVRSTMINAVYDEIVTRTHKDDSPDFVIAKRKIMRDAAESIITNVPMLVDGHVGPSWHKG